MVDNDFVQRLRMNNIFPSGGNNPFSAPDVSANMGGMDMNQAMNAIGSMRANERMANEQRQDNLYYRNKGDKLAEVAQQAAINNPKIGISNLWTQKNGQTMDSAIGRDPNELTAFQKAQLALNREKSELGRDKLEQTGDLGNRKLDISQQRANTYGSMHDMSDSERLDIVNRARRGDIEARSMLERMLQGDRDEAAMSRVNVQQTNANQRNQATIAGANERNTATIEGGIDRDKSKAVGDYIFRNPADKPDVTTSSERTVTQGDNDPIVTKTTTTKGKDPKSGNPSYSIKNEPVFKPGAAPAADKGGIKVMVNGKAMSIEDYNTDPNQQSSDGKKNAAIKILQGAGKPLTPANIEHIMKQL